MEENRPLDIDEPVRSNKQPVEPLRFKKQLVKVQDFGKIIVEAPISNQGPIGNP